MKNDWLENMPLISFLLLKSLGEKFFSCLTFSTLRNKRDSKTSWCSAIFLSQPEIDLSFSNMYRSEGRLTKCITHPCRGSLDVHSSGRLPLLLKRNLSPFPFGLQRVRDSIMVDGPWNRGQLDEGWTFVWGWVWTEED